MIRIHLPDPNNLCVHAPSRENPPSMNNMPNPKAPPCGCKWFEQAANDPDIPIVFDTNFKEYHLVHEQNKGYSLFHHCPFCGGRAPESLRGSQFAHVSSKELIRLSALTAPFLTEEDVRSALGEPDHTHAISGSSTTRNNPAETPETTLEGRCLIYKNLSETAEVRVKIDRYGKLTFAYSGKYIGPNHQ